MDQEHTSTASGNLGKYVPLVPTSFNLISLSHWYTEKKRYTVKRTTTKKFGERTFCAAAPKTWIRMQQYIKIDLENTYIKRD